MIIPKVHSGFTHEEMEEKLKIAGFESVFVHTFHHGKEIFMKKDTSMFLAEAVKQGV
ncbi:hypothetical protein [Salinicoccus sediminis]|uniref:hypothetical protein n=1 Tax=Salinicoccus sediminis TaxID=1432562 RepID=UPI000AD505B2|nr:hypothetical protein [Salinicoccus sediminis]